MPTTNEDLQDAIDALRELILGRHHEIPEEALWTLDEARVRLSHGISAKALSEEELNEWLEDDRTMSYYALQKLRNDELCPIRTISVSGEVKRIPEALCRRHLEQQEEETRPASLDQL